MIWPVGVAPTAVVTVMTLALLAAARFTGGRLCAILPLAMTLALTTTVALMARWPALFAAAAGPPDFDELWFGWHLGRGFR